MTTQELIAKLDAEHDKLEAELPEHYLSFGKYKFWYPGNDEAYQSDKYEIRKKLDRQSDIRKIQEVIRSETERT